jgi:hypothetical protein
VSRTGKAAQLDLINRSSLIADASMPEPPLLSSWRAATQPLRLSIEIAKVEYKVIQARQRISELPPRRKVASMGRSVPDFEHAVNDAALVLRDSLTRNERIEAFA